MRRILVSIAALVIFGGGHAWSQDLRDRFKTQSIEAAKSIDEAIKLSQAKKPKEALKAIDAAIKADGRCQIAHYWRGNILRDTGDIEASIEAFKAALSDHVNRGPQISASTAFNLALTYARLKENEEACLWFTRAILEDHENKYKERGKSYRNMGITLKNQSRPFSAALAVAFAYEDKALNTPETMVRDFFKEVGQQEVARLLFFRDAPPKLEKRGAGGNLVPVQTESEIPEAVDQLFADPEGRYVIAWPKAGTHYHLIDTLAGKLPIKKIDLGNAFNHPCLVEGSLYAVSPNPMTIEKIDVATGKSSTKYSLTGQTVSSLAVLPTQERAYFGSDRIIHELNLKTGKITKTSIPGQLVVAHPTEQFVYSLLMPERAGGGGGHVIINGRPVFFHTGFTDWMHSILFKGRVVPSGLLLAEVRENVASNAKRMSISPDGNWIAVAGGGGWRPTAKDQGFGYGVAVFGTANFEHVQGFFRTDAYPQGVCFNPVTKQVVVNRGQDAKLYHLTDANDAFTINGSKTSKFGIASVWAGHGKYLFLGKEGVGLGVYSNELTAAEDKIALNWSKSLVPVPLPQSSVKAPQATFNAVAGYEAFAVRKPAREEIAKAIANVIESKRAERPGPWGQYSAYQSDKAIQAIEEVRESLAKKDEVGIVIFKLRKALKADEKSVPLQYFLAEALWQSGQADAAEKLFADVIRADAGRTNLSVQSLNSVAAMLGDRDDGLPALQCLLDSLHLDRSNPQTISQAVPIMKKHKFTAEADKIASLSSGTVVAVRKPTLPKLAVPPIGGKKMSPADIYQKAIRSVVLIKTDRGSGSGVCVGANDIIVTNNHVVRDAESAEIFTFTVKDKEPVKMSAVPGQVIYRSATNDIAILRLEKSVDHLVPLAVAATSPAAGVKVFAIGSPGLGKEILEQTISEGIVSAKVRKIDETYYLQHSAPVNPGNSGGPLLDEKCSVVGIVTLNARLANVSFALPAQTLRLIFSQPKTN